MNDNNPAEPRDKVKRFSAVSINAPYPPHLPYSQTKSLRTTSITSTKNKDAFEVPCVACADKGDSFAMHPKPRFHKTHNIIIVNEAIRAESEENNSAAEIEVAENDAENDNYDYDILSLNTCAEKDNESNVSILSTEPSRADFIREKAAVETPAIKRETRVSGSNYNIDCMNDFTNAENEDNKITKTPASLKPKTKSASLSLKTKNKTYKSSTFSSKIGTTTNNNASEFSKSETETDKTPILPKIKIKEKKITTESAEADSIEDKTLSGIQKDKFAIDDTTETTALKETKHHLLECGKTVMEDILTTLRDGSFKTPSYGSHEELLNIGNSSNTVKPIKYPGLFSNTETLTPKDKESMDSKQNHGKPEDQIPTVELNLSNTMRRIDTTIGLPGRYSSNIPQRFLYSQQENATTEDADPFDFMRIPQEKNSEGLQVYFGEMKFESRLEQRICSVMKRFHSSFFEFYVRNQYSLVPCYLGISILKLVNVIIEHCIKIVFSEVKTPQSLINAVIVLGTVWVIEIGIFITVILTNSIIKKKAIQSSLFRHSCPVVLFSFDLFTVILCLHYFTLLSENIRNDNGWCVPTVFLNIVLLPCSVTTSSLLSVIVFAAHVVYNSVNKVRMDFFDRFSKVSLVTWNYLCSFILGFAVKHLCQHTISHGYKECKKIYRRQEEILLDTQRQEYLLKTILPPVVATEILRTVNLGSPSKELALFKRPFMSKYNDVSILFADVVGFTVISSKLKAKDLVGLLDVLFLRFDALSDKYDVLRIEIAGDCYIAVCGTEKIRKDHARQVVRMAMGMVDVMGTVNEVLLTNGYKWNLDLRIGINSGEVVGGVVGRYRWRFDVVGRNVLLANQMETTSQPGKIHITEFTHVRLSHSFKCVPAPDHPFNYNPEKQIVKTFFVKYVVESVKELHSRRYKRSMRRTGSDFNQRQISLDNTVADLIHLEIYNKIAINKLTLTFDSLEIEKTFEKFRIKSSAHDLYLTAMVFGLRYCGSMMRVQIMDSSSMNDCIIFVMLMLISGFAFLPHDSTFLRYYYVRVVRREVYKNLVFRIFIIILIVVSTFVNIYLSVASHFCAQMEKNLTETSSRENRFNFARLCRSSNQLHLVAIMHLISLQSVRESTVIGAVVTVVTSYSLLLLLIKREDYSDAETVNIHIIEAWIFTFILFIAYYVIKLEFRKTFAWRWNVQCSLFRAHWARHTNQALMQNIFPVHVATFFYYQEQGKVQYSQQHEMVAVMFASIMNAKDNLRLKSADDALEWLRLLHSIIMEIDQFLDWPFLEPVTKMKTLGPMYMAASGLQVTNIEKIPEALVAMCEFGLAIIDLIEDLNRKPDNMLHTRIGINMGPVYAGVVCHRRPHYDIWGNTVNVASRMESHGIIGCMQVTTQTMLTLQKISNYKLARRGKIEVKGKGEMVTYFVKRQSVGGNTGIDSVDVLEDERAFE